MNKSVLIFVFCLFVVCLSQTTINIYNNNNAQSSGCEQARKEKAYTEVLKLLYTYITWPNSKYATAYLEGFGPKVDDVDKIFNENVTGRVSPLGNFEGKQHAGEYWFALSGPMDIPGLPEPPRVSVLQARIVNLFFRGDQVSVRAFVDFANPDDRTVVAFTLVQQGIFTFGSDKKIISFDMDILEFGLSNSTGSTLASVQDICNVAFAPNLCTTAQTGYTDYQDCITYLSGVPLGSNYQMDTNTITCRNVHLFLALVNPSVHCNHIGKNSEKCTDDNNYNKFFSIINSLTHSNENIVVRSPTTSK